MGGFFERGEGMWEGEREELRSSLGRYSSLVYTSSVVTWRERRGGVIARWKGGWK